MVRIRLVQHLDFRWNVNSMNNYRAFTLIELVAVILVIGLMASAVVWSLTARHENAQWSDVIDQIRHIDSTARMTARRQGGMQLQFDTDQNLIRRLSSHQSDLKGIAHVIPSGFTLLSAQSLQAFDPNIATYTSSRIDFRGTGCTPDYVVRIARTHMPDDERFILFAGLTGQMKVTLTSKEITAIVDAIADNSK